MATAFVLGNGVTRKGINLEHLRSHGVIYGCNALHRDFTPNVLIATDRPISEQIQHSGYPLKNKFWNCPKCGKLNLGAWCPCEREKESK